MYDRKPHAFSNRDRLRIIRGLEDPKDILEFAEQVGTIFALLQKIVQFGINFLPTIAVYQVLFNLLMNMVYWAWAKVKELLGLQNLESGSVKLE